MTATIPAAARPLIDTAFVMTTLARVHTAWGEAAWNLGNYPVAILNWRVAARYSRAAKQEGGSHEHV